MSISLAKLAEEKHARAAYTFLAVGDGDVNQLGVLGLLGSREYQGRVGGGILWLVLANGCEREALVSTYG